MSKGSKSHETSIKDKACSLVNTCQNLVKTHEVNQLASHLVKTWNSFPKCIHKLLCTIWANQRIKLNH